MRKNFPSLAVMILLAGCANMNGVHPAPPPDRQADAFSTYLSARFASGEHDMDEAARYYSLSLKNDPGNSALLALAFFYATTSGDIEGAGKYATQVAAQSSDDRAARLALSVIAFKHKNYADVRKQLALSAKGPFTVLTVSLFDGWAAAANGDAAGAANDMKTLAAQSGAEGMGAFHAGLIADFMNQRDAAEAFYKKALTINASSPRAIEAYGNFLERMGRTTEASTLYEKASANPALGPVARPGLARIAAGKKPEPMVRNAEDGAAEALFGIAASLTDQASADFSILYLRMALYLRPDLSLAKILLADRFETLRKYEDAVAIYAQVEKSSPYYRMAAVEAAVNRARLNKRDQAISELRVLAEAEPSDNETWIALAMLTAMPTNMTTPSMPIPRRKRRW